MYWIGRLYECFRYTVQSRLSGMLVITTTATNYQHQEDSVEYSRVGAVGVTALAVLARVVEALLYVVVARGSAEAGCARALIRVL